MSFFSIFALFLVVVIPILIERGVTPFKVLATPFFLIVVISYFSSEFLSFIDFDPFLILLWMISLIFFFIGGQFGIKASQMIRFKAYKTAPVKGWVVFFTSTFFSSTLLFNSISVALSLENPILISTDEFSQEIAGGVYEWIRTFNMIFLIYLIGNITKDKKKFIFPIILIVLNLIIFQIKGMLLMPIIAGVFYRIINKNKAINLKTLMAFSLLGFFVFLTLYSLPYLAAGKFDHVFSNNFLESVVVKIFAFLNAGILGFDSQYANEITDKAQIVTPIMNVLRHFFDWDRHTVSTVSHVINYKEGLYSNVSTMFGTFYLHSNLFITSIFALFFGFLSYFQMSLAFKSNNSWDRVLYVYILSILSFGWFEYYFWHQYILSTILIMMVFSFLSRFKINL
jgi:hypothetical protein